MDTDSGIEKDFINSILTDDLNRTGRLLKQLPEGFKLFPDLFYRAADKGPLLKTLRAKVPKFIAFSPSFTCELRCKMCNTGFHDKSVLFEDHPYFLPEEFDKLSPWIDSSSHIFFVGMGETLSSPYILDFLSRLTNKNSRITTSGIPLNKKKIQSLIHADLKFLSLSFDGNTSLGHGSGKSSYAKKFWEKVKMVQTIKKEMNNPLPELGLNITVNGENLCQLGEVFTKAYALGIRTILLNPMTVSNEFLYNNSIFPDFEDSRKKLNKLMRQWNKKGLLTTVVHGKTVRDSIQTCPYVDNWLNFSDKTNSPRICCGSLEMPVDVSGLSKTQYWNSFPFRYFRFLHFCSGAEALPITCQSCWVKDIKQYSRECSTINKKNDNIKAYKLYRKASRLKQDKRIVDATNFLLKILTLNCDSTLIGKTYFHLGEIQLLKKNYSKSLSYMKLAVQYCFEHRMAFAYLYLLLKIVKEPKIMNRRRKINWGKFYNFH